MTGDAATLNLATKLVPGITFFPEMLEGDLILSHGTSPASATSTTTTTADNDTESSASSSVLDGRDVVTVSSEANSSDGGSSSSINSFNSDSSNNGHNASSSSGDGEANGVSALGGSQNGVVWSVSVLPQLSEFGTSLMEWTVFPSSGLLLPGARCVWCHPVWHV